jgi:serine/threonine protein kinase
MHKIDMAESDDASFAHLSADEIAVYFTLTRRMVQPPHESARPVRPDSSGPLIDVLVNEPLVNFGRYRVLEPLSTSGISQLFVAEDRQIGRRVVLKRLIFTLAQNPQWRTRFNREAAIQKNLHIPTLRV